MNLALSEKKIITEPPHEPIASQPIDIVLRQVTLADGHTRPYENAQIDVAVVPPELLERLGAIALYALGDREHQLDIIDDELVQHCGFGINQVDALYQVGDRSYAPPIIELLPGADIHDPDSLNPSNTQIVDGLHRTLRSLKRREPIVMAIVSHVDQSVQLPFVSIPLSEVTLVESVPETKRIVSDHDLTEEQVRSRYRNFKALGSNHRDETSVLRPLIPWEVYQVERDARTLKNWADLTKDLKRFTPPIPSVLDPPPTRIMIGPEGDVHSRSHHLSHFGRTVRVSEHLTVAEFFTWRMTSSDFYRRPTPAAGFGEAILVDRKYWQQTATKLVTVISSADSESIPSSGKLANLTTVNHKAEAVTYETGSKEMLDERDRKTGFKKVTSKSGNVFLSQAADGGKGKLISLDKTILQSGRGIVLGLRERTLFGINYYAIDNDYRTSWYENALKAKPQRKGPVLLASPETTQFVNFNISTTVGSPELKDISLTIIDSVAKTKWYNPGIDSPVPEHVSGASAAAELERRVNYDTVWGGIVEPAEIFRLVGDGLIPDPSTIVGAIIANLPNIEIEQDTYIVMEEHETPFGNIFVLPTLPVKDAKTVNSMKLPTSFTRMDMSFTLPQTNLDKLSSRTSSGALRRVKITDIFEKMAEASEHIPFDVETLSHVFSSLIQTGKIRLIQ